MNHHGNNLNVFRGQNAVRDFLDPTQSPPLPLVEIPQTLNPLHADGVRIYAKLMNMLPLGNIKSLPAYNMLLAKQDAGELGKTRTLIENSSGNTVFSLAVLGRLFGIHSTRAIVSNEVSPGKLSLLRFFGTEIMVNKEPICPDPNDTTSGIYMAKKLGKKKGWFNPGQYDNVANPEAHMKWTGPQLWQQTEGKLCIFCAGLGTTGTILGTSNYLKSQNPEIVTVGVSRKPNNPVPGVRTPNLLQQIAFDWKRHVDHTLEIGTQESFAASLALSRSGIMVGPSSGFALAGLIEFLQQAKKEGTLDLYKNSDGEILAAFICPDSPLPYIDEYFEYLPSSNFPEIENEHLLVHSRKNKEPVAAMSISEVSVQQAYEILYSENPIEIWNAVNTNKKVSLKKGVILIDVRTDMEFSHFHLPGSIHIELQVFTTNIKKYAKKYKDKKVLFICKSGNRSGIAASLARTNGLDTYNIMGGVTEWSARNLPRIRPDICIC